MPAQNSIDWIINMNIKDPGFFIEAGGSDPFDQNNTELLEKNGWTGLIVEPKEDFNFSYSQLRPKSIVENYVLVSNNYLGEKISGDFSHWMMGGVVNIHNLNWNPKEYRCITLEKLLEKHNIKEVTFFSLDVEGYEVEVLEGIDFEKVFFHVIVLENHSTEIKKYSFEFLENYDFEKKFTIGQHEFYINKKSKYSQTFTI